MPETKQAAVRGLAAFFALAFAISWSAWAVAIGAHGAARLGLIALGGCGPSLAAVALVLADRDRARRAELWRSAFDPRRPRPSVVAAALLLCPALLVLSLLAARAFGGAPLPLTYAAHLFGAPLALVRFALLMLIAGPLSEELGWRGVALPLMAERWSVRRASLVLGVPWAAWHLPLFLIPGTTQHALGFAPLPLALFAAQSLALSVIVGALWSRGGRSTLAAILVHAASNAALTIATGVGGVLPFATYACVTALYVLAAGAIAITGGPTLAGRSS